MRRFSILLLAWALGCERAPTQAQPTQSPAQNTVVVFAAASLQDAFHRIGRVFEQQHAGADVVFNFAGSQELRTQLEHGARADVFASADQRNMEELQHQGLVFDAVVFARNEPVIVVAQNCSVQVDSIADLPRLSRIVLGAPEVPIGRYSRQILDRATQAHGKDFRARVEAKVVSLELNVRQALSRVVLGEAEAAIVYRSDALSVAGKVKVVSIAPEINIAAEYPMARLVAAEHPDSAAQWQALVRSAAGQEQLVGAGFMPPGAPLP